LTSFACQLDYSGQRIKKTVSQSGITTRFAGQLYEEDNTGAEYQHVFAGNTRVATIAPLGVKFYHGDHLGGRSVVTDSDGLEVDHIDYKPFGEINRHDAVASEEGHHFTDQYRDDETELYYYNSRYYNPKIGRFVQPDSLVPGEDNPQAFNRYSYVFNNPVKLVDPEGESPYDIVKGFFGGILDTVKSIANPIKTGQDLGNFLADLTFNYAETAAAVKTDFKQQISTEEGRDQLIGRGIAAIAVLKYASGRAKVGVVENAETSVGTAASNTKNITESIASKPVGTKSSPLEVKPGTNTPATINGREYSGHALDRMQGRGIFPSVVENTIQNGQKLPGNVAGRVLHYDPVNNISVVTDTTYRSIITVRFGKP